MKKIWCFCLALSIFATSALAFSASESWHPTHTKEQQILFDKIAETVELRNESIAQSFGIDFSGFTKIRVTQSEALAPEYMDMAFVASALIDMHAGDSVLIGHVNPDRDLMYVTKQDAELINHLYTFTCDEEGIWHLDGEITTASSGVSNADVAQAKLAYDMAVMNEEAVDSNT